MKALAVLLSLWMLAPAAAEAWGDRGHGAIGVLAVEQLTPGTRAVLDELLGATDTDVIVGACVWSDTWRGIGDGRDQSRWHYVNIDPQARSYNWTRDCPEADQCVTAQVNAHARTLGDLSQSKETRRLAFKGLCHFLGDLHQPMHVGYADDRGGNDVTIRYLGQSMSLHRYWDTGIIEANTRSMAELVEILRERPNQRPGSWTPSDTIAWTNETFALLRNFGYPATNRVDEGFEQRSWQVAQQQLDVAAGRLTTILEWVLGADTP